MSPYSAADALEVQALIEGINALTEEQRASVHRLQDKRERDSRRPERITQPYPISTHERNRRR